jgi:hypothetical protein
MLDHEFVRQESLLGRLCRALTAQSPLTELVLGGSDENDDWLPDLAHLIAHNQTRLKTLSLCHYCLSSGGCDCPSSAAPECWAVALM